MDIDKLIRGRTVSAACGRFGSLMDIDKLIRAMINDHPGGCFGSLMDIDKLILTTSVSLSGRVLVL